MSNCLSSGSFFKNISAHNRIFDHHNNKQTVGVRFLDGSDWVQPLDL